LAVFWSLA